MSTIQVWTDGCVLRNPGGPGGWAFVAVLNGEIIARESGGEDETTNNIMEMTAVLEAIQWAVRTHGLTGRLRLYSDSEYVVKGINEWMRRWKHNGWSRKAKVNDPPKNLALWQDLDANFQPQRMEIAWLRGHDGHQHNEEADDLAGRAAREIANLPEPRARRNYKVALRTLIDALQSQDQERIDAALADAESLYESPELVR